MFCKNSYIAHFLASTLKIFSEKTLFYFGKRKWSFLALYISYISGSNFPSSKSKKNPLVKSSLYFEKWNFPAPSLKNLYFRRELAISENQKFLKFHFKHNRKRKSFSYLYRKSFLYFSL